MGLMFRVTVLTGMRRGEPCGLRWAGADLDRGVLTVSRTLLQLGRYISKDTWTNRDGSTPFIRGIPALRQA